MVIDPVAILAATGESGAFFYDPIARTNPGVVGHLRSSAVDWKPQY
jgi:hypothetical protein